MKKNYGHIPTEIHYIYDMTIFLFMTFFTALLNYMSLCRSEIFEHFEQDYNQRNEIKDK